MNLHGVEGHAVPRGLGGVGNELADDVGGVDLHLLREFFAEERDDEVVEFLGFAKLVDAGVAEASFVPAPAPEPVYGWRKLLGETFELQALGKQKVAIVHADTGVFGGVFDPSRIPNVIRRPAFAVSSCPLVAIVEASTTCKLKSDSRLVYVVRDKRSEAALVIGSYFALHKIIKPLERATVPNRVSIKIEDWGCVTHCPASGNR